MATYKEIHGVAVKDVSSDPTNSGEVFYNSTTDTFRTIVQSTAWSSASPLITPTSYSFGGGTQTAAFSAGGVAAASTVQTEEYNGSGWSLGGDIGTARYEGGSAGTQTAGLIFGGYNGPPAPSPYPKAQTEEYNGTSWSEQNDLNNAGYSQGGFGIQTAAVYSNRGLSPGNLNDTEEYDGTSWSEGNNSTLTRYDVGTAGTQTAGMIFGGQGGDVPTVTGVSELYDGTNWTTGPTMTNARSQLGGSGVQTAAIAFGGRFTPPGSVVRAFTEQYDGTSWSETADLATARRQVSSTRTETGNSQALAFGGNVPPHTSATEEFSQSTNLITAAAFSSGNNQNLSSYNRSGWGTQNAACVAGGGYPSDKNESEEYDGTTWTEGNNLNTARNSAAVGGPQTAAIFATGSRSTNVEYYDGTSWTAQPASPQVRSSAAGGGTQTSFVMAGGSTAGSPYYPISTTGEEWNGSSWTSAGALPAPQGSMNGSALGESESAVILAGGASSPAGSPGYVPHVVTNVSLDYGGTSWTANPNINTARVSPYFFGTTSLGILAGGDTNNSGATTTISEQWNGSVFVTGVNMATGRYTGGRAGTATAGLVAGGYPGTTASANATEEYTGETIAANVKTITTS